MKVIQPTLEQLFEAYTPTFLAKVQQVQLYQVHNGNPYISLADFVACTCANADCRAIQADDWVAEMYAEFKDYAPAWVSKYKKWLRTRPAQGA